MPTDQPSDLNSEARRWVVHLHSGAVTQSESDELARWRNQSAAHDRAFADASTQWNVLRVAARNVTRKEAAAAPEIAVSRRIWLSGAIAASIGGVAYLAVRPPLDLWPSLAEFAADYRTEVGERREVTFANQVSVEMNTRTSLAVAKSASETSEIELISGEIAVTASIGRIATAPFVVVAGNGRTLAAQAALDLRYEGQIVTVNCLEGKAQVECLGAIAKLGARQQVLYDAGGLGAITATDGRYVSAWREGLLVFDNQPLSQVVPEINRYRRGRIVLLNDAVGRLPLDATVRLDRIDEIVPKIVHLFGLKARLLPGGVVLLS
jgi:transmembrane sensor